MSDPQEVELKLELDPVDRARLQRSALFRDKTCVTTRLLSDYYDTPDRDLYAAGFSLRLRRGGGATVQTVKAEGGRAAGLFVRPEWERTVDGTHPVVDETSGPIKELIGDRPAILQFTTDISRTVRMVAPRGASIELALDDGEVRAGSDRVAICELELELKLGSPAALFTLARRINATIPLRLGVLSKSERGYALAGAGRPIAVKAEPITLDPQNDACEAFATIARSCIRHFRLNEALLIETGSVEPLHQARVALRRLRSAFSLFKPLLKEDKRGGRLREELRWLTASLGEVRNLDVVIERVSGPVRDRLVDAREEALSRVLLDLASMRCRALMIDLAEWLAIGAWRTREGDQPIADMGTTELASALLERHRKRIKRRGRHLSRLTDDHRHEVRIEAKKLRYATEFFSSLYGSKKAQRRSKAFLAAMEKLQDRLGELNDQATAPHVFAELGLEPPAPLGPKQRAALLAKAERGLERLLDVKRFWR